MPSATLDSILSKAYEEEGLSEADILCDKGFIPSGNLALDYSLGGRGFPKGRSIELYGQSMTGKAQPLNAQVLTPTGFRRMGDLKVGDPVIDPEGQPSDVTGIFPQGEQDVYRVTFSDGSSCECTSDHLWPFRYRVWRRTEEGGRNTKRKGVLRPKKVFTINEVVPLRTMMTPSRLKNSAARPSLSVELRSDLDFIEDNLPLDPYLFGLLLGDGTLDAVTPLYTSEDDELIEAVRSTIPDSTKLVFKSQVGNGRTYSISSDWCVGGVCVRCARESNDRLQGRGLCRNCYATVSSYDTLSEWPLLGRRPNKVRQSLLALNACHKSELKFVPEIYKISSAKTRLALLQGLMDTDAEANPGAGVFGSASKRLRDDVVWLARSLGYRVTISQRKIKGERVGGGEYFISYSARVSGHSIPVFRLGRKLTVWMTPWGNRPGWERGIRPRVLISIEFSRVVEAQCISVSASSNLYVTDDFIPTHNTTTACMVASQAQKLGLLVVYMDFEQALDEPYLNALGVNTRDPKLFRPFPAGSLESGADVATQVARTGEVGLLVFDSVPAMVPRSSAVEDKDSRMLAMERARLLGNLQSKLNPIQARTGMCSIFINHIHDVVETGFVRPGMPKRTSTPGGTALKFYSSVRVEFTIVKKLKAERVDPLTGEKITYPHSVLSRATVTKNKLAPPYQSAELYLELGKGFNNAYSAMQALVGNKVVKKAGAYYQFPDDLYHPNMTTGAKGPSLQGMQSVLDIAATFPEWEAQLVKRAVAVLPRENITLSLPVIETDSEDAGSEDSVLDSQQETDTILSATVSDTGVLDASGSELTTVSPVRSPSSRLGGPPSFGTDNGVLRLTPASR